MGRTRYHHGDLRKALLDAAEALVRELENDDWSLREVSARVGVSPSAAYHHFSSRDALIGTLSQQIIARLGERMTNAANDLPHPAADPYSQLVAIGCVYVRWAVDDPAVARLAFGAGVRDAEATPSPHPHDVLSFAVDRLVDAGVLPEHARPGADFVVWAALHGLVMLVIDGLMTLDGPDAVDLEAERVIRAVLGGLAREVTPPSPWPTARSSHTDRLAHAKSAHDSR